MPFLPLAFFTPAVLAALALLPVLWLLLRLTPPRPSEIPFPPLRLILDLRGRDDAPAHTPWWLLLLRMAVATAIILAMAGPVWNPPPTGLGGRGPELVLVDDGWTASADWEARTGFLAREIGAAVRGGRPVVLAPLSAAASDLTPLDPADWTGQLHEFQPQAWIPDRAAALAGVRRFLAAHPDTDVVWLSDGVEQGGARAFAEALLAAAPRHVRIVSDGARALGLAGVENAAAGLQVRLVRAGPDAPRAGVLQALDRKGRELGRTPFDFKTGAVARAAFDLPVELRNQAARIDVVGRRSAGATALLDFRAQRRRIGVLSGDSADLAQPYIAPEYFLDKALAPYADVTDARPGAVDPIAGLLADHPSALILADVGRLTDPDLSTVRSWVNDGGVLIRFAGTRVAESVDDLIPVRLRDGGRVLGAALSWDTPKRLAPFDRASPFFGLTVPNEVTVRRQVLAEPDADLTAKVWAALTDGTPLVTAARSGKGLIVLFHVTADTSWSNLPLSGLFVDMLRRVADMATPGGGGARPQQNTVGLATPTSILDGFGELGPPPSYVRPIATDFVGPPDRQHPPGLYGPAEAAVALNAMAAGDRLDAANFNGLAAAFSSLGPAVAFDLRPLLILAAFALFALDAAATLWLSRGARLFRRRAAVGLVMFAAACACCAPRPAQAADAAAVAAIPSRDVAAALETSLAYVVTGDAAVDAESKAGLTSLSDALTARTSFLPGPPVGVDPAHDELVFYPMIYWPVVADAPQPSAVAVQKIATFMKEGGTIVFDTRDALESRPDGPPTPETLWLRKLLAGVDVPELEPVPRDHVITKTFYLLDGFVGRTTVGQTWIQALPPPAPGEEAARPARAGDGVSPIILASNDLAAAWAATPDGEPLYPLTPGGDRQHEMALRGGINIVMYTLTGNYKADQVHVRDLLNRLTR